MPPSFKGQRVWVTGASLGIGRAVALELASRGADLVLTARGEDKLEELRRKAEQRGVRAIVKAGDVTDAARMKAIVEEAEQELGPIDILIANAGTHVFTEPRTFDADEYLDLMNLNYGGALRCFEAVLPGMLERKRGRIVGVASLAGFRGVPRAAAYGASKAALINFLESVRFHLAPDVGVTVVSPGFVRTPLTDKNDFHMPFLMEADKAARVICDGVIRGRKQIIFPAPFSWTIQLLRVVPFSLYHSIMGVVWKRMQAA